MAEFTVGDMAVYQDNGVGEITDINTMEISGAQIKFYVLRMLENGATIRIPTSRAASIGLREVIPAETVPEVYAILREKGKKPEDKTWNRRYRAYKDKLKTGSVYEIARVLRDLYRLQAEKELSYGERQMLGQARNLLVKELSIATSRDESEISQELEDLFSLVEA